MAIATAAQVRDGYLRVVSGTAEDSLIDTFIARFDDISSAYCGFPVNSNQSTFENNTYTHYFDGDGSGVLQLRVIPANTITSVHVDVDRDYGASSLVASSDYTLDTSEGLVILNTDSTQGAFDKGYRSVKVIYTAGFTTIPDGIVHACGMQVSHWYRNRDNIGFQNVSQQGGSIRVDGLQLLASTRQALAPYRLAGAIGGFLG